MAPNKSDLEAPVLLIAMPQVLDPYFHRTVILLCHHDEEEGSFGFIINRPTRIRVPEILRGMDLDWQGDRGAVVFYGGPVQPNQGAVFCELPQGLTMGPEPGEPLEGDAEATLEGAVQWDEAPGLVLSQHIGDLDKIAAAPPEDFRLYLGYAGWGGGQLLEEILRNDWLMAPIQRDLVFHPDPESAWEAALSSVGVEAGSLPSWTAGSGDGEAN